VRRIVEKRIKPELGMIKVTALSRSDVKAWHQAMSATPYEGNRALAYCSKMMGLAVEEWELRPDNPCTGIKRFREQARERFFSDDELKAIGAELLAVERDGSEPAGFVLLIRLLATTGMRLSEARGLLWSDVDLPGRTIRLRDAKAGGRTVHLGGDAVAILDATTERGVYVITGFDPEKPLTESAAEKGWARLRVRAGLTGARIHDLRHTAGTFAALSGANAFAIRDMLGHKTMAMTGRYVGRAADMARATADAVASRMASAMSAAEREPASVFSLLNSARRK
jgi:integrase